MDLIMDDAERRGEAPRERMRAEYNRFPLRVVSDGDSTDDDGVERKERREANHYGKVSTPMELFLTNADGLVRGPFADLESALIAQGGRLVDPRHVLRFDSIGCAERYMYGGECERSRAEYCHVVMFLDRGTASRCVRTRGTCASLWQGTTRMQSSCCTTGCRMLSQRFRGVET